MRLRKRILIPALPMLLLLCAGIGILYLRSERFQEYARSAVISRIENATGLECGIDSFRFDLFRGDLLIRGLTLSARPGAPSTVNASVEEVGASISISSFWHLRIRLGRLNVVRPRLELVSGKGDSSWNPEALLDSLRISLRLEASEVTIQDGWLKINNRTQPFQISIDDLDCEIRYSKQTPSYRVRVEYRKSLLFWEQRDIVHGLRADADVSMEGIAIHSFEFRHGNTVFSGSGSMKDWNAPVLLIHFAGSLDAGDLKLAHASLYEGRGRVAVAGDLTHDTRGVHLTGKFTAGTGGYRKMNFTNLSGSYEIRDDVLHLRSVTGKISDGKFLVNAAIQLRDSNKDPNRIVIDAEGVPVIDAGRLLNLPLINFSNRADTHATLMWYGGKELRADCDAMVHASTEDSTIVAKSSLLEGRVRFTYFEPGAVLVDFADLQSPHTRVRASGGRESIFNVQMSTSRLAEPFDLIAGFSPPVADFAAREPDVKDMSGEFDFDGLVHIQSSSEIEYNGRIGIRNGRWRSYKLDSLSARAHFHSPELILESLKIYSDPAVVEGDLDLRIGDDYRIAGANFKGSARRVPLSMLQDFGIGIPDLTGSLSGSATARFEQNSWNGSAEFSIVDGSASGEPFENLRARLSLSGQKIRIAGAEIRRGKARGSGEGEVDLQSRQLNLAVRVRDLPLGDLSPVKKRGLAILADVNALGNLKGTIEKPAFLGSFEIGKLQYKSWNFGSGSGQIEFENGIIRTDVRMRSDFADLSLESSISADRGHAGQASIKFRNLNIQKVTTAKAPSYFKDLSTALQGSLEVEGNFDNPESLRIRGEVDGAHFRINNYELHNSELIRFSILDRTLWVEKAVFMGEGTRLLLSGAIPFDESPRLDLELNGTLNLALLEGVEEKLHTAGSASLSIRAAGSRRDPEIIGKATFQDARLDYKDFPFRFSSMKGDIVFSSNLVRFENVRGSAGSGTISVTGVLEHQRAVLRSINLGISLRNARLPYPKDFRSIGDADLVLSGSGDTHILSGNIYVTRMEYLRNFDLLEQLAGRSVSTSGPLTTEPYLLGLRLNIEIDSDNGLMIDNELTRLRGGMRLTLRGTPAYPSLTGRVEALEGTIFFRGSRFEISHASADFIDRNRINPVLEIRAEADVKTYRLILDAVGELDRLNLNITSDPPMSTVDILSLLTTGKSETGGATSQRESQMAGMSAASVLSQNLTGVIGKRVQRIFGLESFRVDPFLAGAENDPTARITISERLSKDLVVTFSRNLTTNQEQIVVIEYDVGKNLSIVATRDENGKYGLDFRFRKRIR